MVDISSGRAIHTHAEATCRHLPTVPETAPHEREQDIAAVIRPVVAGRETGNRRGGHEVVAELATLTNDAPIPLEHGRSRGRFSRPRYHSRIAPARRLADVRMIIIKGNAAPLIGVA
ncbi:hypothetical protein [Roseicyclus amphidinii]|uniref:hypothetical protein n=1 Tax=Roseicyclus amphidinii TaxID=3034232 RepID=UPI0024E0C8E0|nr:hypothetical protein [Roseicyclus sp. Amp-Y-6]